MALNADSLAGMIVAELQAQGFVTAGEHARVQAMAQAVAEAVVAHISASAQVVVSSGSSAGTYQVT